MKKIKRSVKRFMVGLMKARQQAAIAKAKSGFYYWD